MLLLTVQQLEDCQSEFQRWHEESFIQLNDVQIVEYRRLITLFESTKYWYRTVIENSVEERKKSNRETAYFWGLGFLVLLIFWIVYGSQSSELKIITTLFFLLGIFRESTSRIVDREIAAEIRKINRDLSLTGLNLSIAYKIIQKENQYQKVLSSNEDLDSEIRGKAILQANILKYYWLGEILVKVSGSALALTRPLANIEIIDFE